VEVVAIRNDGEYEASANTFADDFKDGVTVRGVQWLATVENDLTPDGAIKIPKYLLDPPKDRGDVTGRHDHVAACVIDLRAQSVQALLKGPLEAVGAAVVAVEVGHDHELWKQGLLVVYGLGDVGNKSALFGDSKFGDVTALTKLRDLIGWQGAKKSIDAGWVKYGSGLTSFFWMRRGGPERISDLVGDEVERSSNPVQDAISTAGKAIRQNGVGTEPKYTADRFVHRGPPGRGKPLATMSLFAVPLG
jgi:hypothetical protein